METLILGWFVLVKTELVLLLTLFGSLQFLGTLLSPMFGVAGDRLGRRTMLCIMRAFYAVLAVILMTLALAEVLQPVHVFPIAFLSGLVRPSDLVMRNALVGDTMPGASLMGALGLSRMTMDSARIFGALVGASLFAAFGIGLAYTGVATFYVLSFLLTLGVSRAHPQGEAEPASGTPPPATLIGARWRELRDGMSYVWHTPSVLCLIWLAFLVNLTAFPLSHSLLPYVAREIYATDATGLGHLVAAFATGALLGSTIMTVAREQSSRFMVICIALWYALIAVFARMTAAPYGMSVLFVMGVCHSLGMVTMSGVLLRIVADRFRGRVMGIRMLAVYGLPLGLLISGPLVERFGYPATATLYVAIGLTFTAVIAWRWRAIMWKS